MTKLGEEAPGVSPEERAANAAKYEADTEDFRAAQLQAARGELVREYRAHPGKWPNGIDTKHDRWYRPEDWGDDGVLVKKKNVESGS